MSALHPNLAASRQNNFELLRLFAALQVLLVHGIDHLQLGVPPLLRHALGLFPGVSIFFVISGFLITDSLQRAPSLAHYARNRVLRIFPALWMCSLLTLLLLYATGQLHAGPRAIGLWLLGQSTIAPHTPDFLRGWGSGSVNGSLWTIPVEIQFYLALPLLLWWLRRSRRRQLAALALALLAGCAYLQVRQAYAGQLPARLLLMCLPSWLYLFLLGVLLQLHRARLLPWLQGRALWWALAYLGWSVLLGSAGLSVEGNNAGPLTTIPLGLLVVACAYTAPGLAQRALHGQDLSYGLYIYHMLIINVLVQQGWLGDWRALGVAASVTLALAWLSWHGLEAPALQLKTYRLRQGKAAGPA